MAFLPSEGGELVGKITKHKYIYRFSLARSSSAQRARVSLLVRIVFFTCCVLVFTCCVLIQVSEIMKNAEAKGEEGEVDEAQELFQEAEELQQQKASLEAKALQVRLPP